MTRTIADVDRDLDVENAKIDAAYWAFTRQARARPPSLVVPEAYRRREELETERAEILGGETA